MGFISKVRNAGIVTKQAAASSVGALRAKAPLAMKIAGGAKSLVVGGAKFVFKKSPIGTAVLATGLAFKGAKYLKRKLTRQKSAVAQANPSSGAKYGGFADKVVRGIKAHPIATAAGLATAAYVAEQVAEKAGVRGGAGFFGRRPKKRSRAKSSRQKTKARRSGRRRSVRTSRARGLVSFTTKDGRKVSFAPRKRGSRRRIRHTRRGWRQDRRMTSKQPWEQRYRRRR